MSHLKTLLDSRWQIPVWSKSADHCSFNFFYLLLPLYCTKFLAWLLNCRIIHFSSLVGKNLLSIYVKISKHDFSSITLYDVLTMLSSNSCWHFHCPFSHNLCHLVVAQLNPFTFAWCGRFYPHRSPRPIDTIYKNIALLNEDLRVTTLKNIQLFVFLYLHY